MLKIYPTVYEQIIIKSLRITNLQTRKLRCWIALSAEIPFSGNA